MKKADIFGNHEKTMSFRKGGWELEFMWKTLFRGGKIMREIIRNPWSPVRKRIKQATLDSGLWCDSKSISGHMHARILGHFKSFFFFHFRCLTFKPTRELWKDHISYFQWYKCAVPKSLLHHQLHICQIFLKWITVVFLISITDGLLGALHWADSLGVWQRKL